jgi:hypothetical protein
MGVGTPILASASTWEASGAAREPTQVGRYNSVSDVDPVRWRAASIAPRAGRHPTAQDLQALTPLFWPPLNGEVRLDNMSSRLAPAGAVSPQLGS